MKPLVTIRDLQVELGGKLILKGVNAQLARGKITALIGRNGSGKTTLIRTLVKEVPYKGQISFHCGHNHQRPTPEHVGYVPQKLRIEGQVPVTVIDLFALTLQHRRPLFFGIGRPFRKRVADLLTRVKAGHLVDSPVDKLSGGELQRVLLALALEPSPELLLLDEPAAGIDFQETRSFDHLIGELNASLGITVLLVSHELSVVSDLADHVLCLEDGQIQCEGPPQQIITQEVLAKTFGSGTQVYRHPHFH